jgi:MFS transporter, FSR family, fosmidomycin resistance protein
VFALVLAMGFGVAAYHPEGYKTATSVGGDRKATAVSWFSLGGNVGIAVGAPAITLLVTTFGLSGSLALIAPATIVALLFVAVLPRLAAAAPRTIATATIGLDRVNRPWAMALLVLVVMIRSWTSLGFTTFVPLYYVDVLHADPRMVGTLLFVFLGVGALGTVIAGPIADRIGMRPVMIGGFVAAMPLAALFLALHGPLALVALGLTGATLVSTFTVSVVLAQQYLPRNTGMASGLIVGFAFGTGGLGVAALGWVADLYGLKSALWITALTPIVGAVAAAFLPTPRRS